MNEDHAFLLRALAASSIVGGQVSDLLLWM